MQAARWADRLLWVVKWPVAVSSLIFLPASAKAFAAIVSSVASRHESMLPFIAGFWLYALVWWLFLRRPAWGSLVSTLEHEITHAIFAWLTFHSVVGMTTSWKSGGHTVYTGGPGNWLISVSPYFFPTLSVIAAGALAFLPAEHFGAGMGALGATLAYHLLSSWKETHSRQTDLRQAGFLFCLAFLPTANLVGYGLILAFARGGPSGAAEHVDSIAAFASITARLVADLIRG